MNQVTSSGLSCSALKKIMLIFHFSLVANTSSNSTFFQILKPLWWFTSCWLILVSSQSAAVRGLFLFWWQFSESNGSTVQLTGVAAALLLAVGGASREREHSRARHRVDGYLFQFTKQCSTVMTDIIYTSKIENNNIEFKNQLDCQI